MYVKIRSNIQFEINLNPHQFKVNFVKLRIFPNLHLRFSKDCCGLWITVIAVP